MTNQTDFKLREVFEEFKFYEEFLKLIKNEKSNFGKLLLQENLIFRNIIYILHGIRIFINFSIIHEFCLIKSLKGIRDLSINIPEDKLLFRDFTLGRLVGLLKFFLSQRSKVINDLNKYNTQRNNITHKMFNKYKNINQINKDAEITVKLGEEILESLNKLDEHLRKSGLILCRRYYNL